MLGRKKAGQLALEILIDEITAVPEFAVRGSLVAEKSESLPQKPAGWRRKEMIYTKRYHR